MIENMKGNTMDGIKQQDTASIKKYIRRRYDDPEAQKIAYMLLGEIHLLNGHKTSAEIAYAKAKGLDPNDKLCDEWHKEVYTLQALMFIATV